MMFLAPVIVFAGVAGGHHDKVEHQLAPVLAKIGVSQVAMAPADLAQLARHSDRAKAIVAALHVDGVIGGALVTAGGALTFRVVIYDGQGNMRSLGETPLATASLTKDDLEVLASNLGSEVDDLGKLVAKEPKPEPAPAPKPAPAPAPAAPTVIAEPQWEGDAKPEPQAPPASSESVQSSPSSGDVSMAEIEAMTGGDPSGIAATSTPASTDTLHLHLGAGLALIGRTFGAPSGLAGYTSTPVGGAHFTAGIAPTAHATVDFAADRTLGMSTTLASGNAITVISRWDATAGYSFIPQLAGTIGLGHRGFSIESADPGRSPDNEYNYVAIGMRLQQPIGERFVLRGNFAFEPVFAGTDGMEMALGPSTRWGLDLGIGLDLRVSAHISARAAFDYQRFSWSWDAGARGASGAADNYPSGSLGLATEL